MKRTSLLFLCFILCFGQAYAESQHAHSQKGSSLVKKTAKSVNWPGRCEIMIVNNSYEPVQVYGMFDDGEGLRFNVLPSDPPHYISLFYYGYCHYDMYVSIQSFNGFHLYSGYPSVGSTIEIIPYFSKQLKSNQSQVQIKK